jgi:hypothetical protein
VTEWSPRPRVASSSPWGAASTRAKLPKRLNQRLGERLRVALRHRQEEQHLEQLVVGERVRPAGQDLLAHASPVAVRPRGRKRHGGIGLRVSRAGVRLPGARRPFGVGRHAAPELGDAERLDDRGGHVRGRPHGLVEATEGPLDRAPLIGPRLQGGRPQRHALSAARPARQEPTKQHLAPPSAQGANYETFCLATRVCLSECPVDPFFIRIRIDGVPYRHRASAAMCYLP